MVSTRNPGRLFDWVTSRPDYRLVDTPYSFLLGFWLRSYGAIAFRMIHTDGKPTIAMKESDAAMGDPIVKTITDKMYGKDPAYDPDKNYFKEYKGIPSEKESHFLIVEIEGPVEKALDLRSNLEKLEYPGIGMTAIFDLEEMAARKYVNLIKEKI